MSNIVKEKKEKVTIIPEICNETIVIGNHEVIATIDKHIYNIKEFDMPKFRVTVNSTEIDMIKETMRNHKHDLYSYKIIYKNTVIDKDTVMFETVSKNYNAELLKGLLNYYSFIVRKFIQLDYSPEYYNQQMLGYAKDIEKFTQSLYNLYELDNTVENFIKNNTHNIFTKELIVEYLMLLCKIYPISTNDTLQKFFDKFNENMQFSNNGNLLIELYQCAVPPLINLTEKEIRFAEEIKGKFLHDDNLLQDKFSDKVDRFGTVIYNNDKDKRVSDYSLKMLYKMLYFKNRAEEYKDCDVLFKDCEIKDHNFKYKVNETLNMTCYDSEVLDYINDLTIRDFLKVTNIFYQFRYKCSVNVFKKMSEIIINGELIKDKDLQSSEITEKFIVKDDNRSANVWITNNALLMSSYGNIFSNFTKKFVLDYLNKVEDHSIDTDSEIFNIIKLIIDYTRNYDNTQSKIPVSLGIGIHYLSKIMSDDEIMELMIVIREYDKLNVDALLNYYDNYEEYKDMPIFWCVEML